MSTPYGLGRVPHFDERSRNYPARALLPDAAPLVTKTWRRGHAYDQGQTPQCVAYTGKGILNTAPASAAVPYRTRIRYSTDDLYAGAQREDQWPGEDYDGTSALGLGKYLLGQGLVSEYRWCFGLDEVLTTLSHVGPVGIGVGWRSNMWDTDADGFLNVSGDDVGGHEVELVGVNVEDRYVVGTNSWGTTWGVGGRLLLTWEALGKLLDADGDAVVLVP